jgi:hypothetical protein
MPNQNERKAGRMKFAYGHPVWAAPMRSRRYRSFWIAVTYRKISRLYAL